MAITYKYIDPPSPEDNPQIAVNFMKDTLVPLLQEYWEKEGNAFWGKPLNVNVISLIQLWYTDSLVVVVAYDNGKPAGFFLGIRFSHLLFNIRAIKIELCYAPTDEMKRGIIQYLTEIAKFMSVNELWVDGNLDKALATTAWEKKNVFDTIRYVKR